MSILSRLDYYLSEKGRFNSFTMHMLGYPVALISMAILLCFTLSDLRAKTFDAFNLLYFLLFFLGLFLLFAFKSGKPRPSVGVFTIIMMYIAAILISALPYISQGFDVKESIFEATSGITTTGLTLLDISTGINNLRFLD